MGNQWYSTPFKQEVVLAYHSGNYTLKEICSEYQVTKYSVLEWVKRFELYGIEGLEKSTSWKSYPKESKEAAVRDYLSGQYSQYEIVRMYDISSRSVLQRWVKRYNEHRELKDTSKGRTSSMAKGRKTTWEERIQIVLFCIENNKNYQMAAETYKISYQQVYQWVKKYEDGGE
ncbi:transposase, partial [Tepidibacillus sp. LV47]|uniref:transposase n=1 Tax=Tepidibacillus sp. LV47 TaxID=3398228 RepID=UPI003AB05D94